MKDKDAKLLEEAYIQINEEDHPSLKAGNDGWNPRKNLEDHEAKLRAQGKEPKYASAEQVDKWFGKEDWEREYKEWVDHISEYADEKSPRGKHSRDILNIDETLRKEIWESAFKAGESMWH
jgi:hypothetical protein